MAWDLGKRWNRKNAETQIKKSIRHTPSGNAQAKEGVRGNTQVSPFSANRDRNTEAHGMCPQL